MHDIICNESAFKEYDSEESKQLKEALGVNIKKLRMYLGISSERFAEIINVSESFIGLVERGERGLALTKLYRIKKIFNIGIDELLEESFSPEKIFAYNIGELEDCDNNLKELLTTLINNITFNDINSLLKLSIIISKNKK